jgi:hypothetical protein
VYLDFFVIKIFHARILGKVAFWFQFVTSFEFWKTKTQKSDNHVRTFVFLAVAYLGVVESIDVSSLRQNIIVW